MIEVVTLTKRFGGKKRSPVFTAVDQASFTADDGCITGLLGPNGAGKTTLLRMLAGVLAPDGGAARIDGTDALHNNIAARSALGVLADAKGIYPRLTGRENIQYYGELHGLSGPALARRVDQLIEALGMANFAQRRAQGFSQGERMKVALARAVVHDPHNIILDEPTNGLDVLSVRALRETLRSWRAAGKCVLLSSHVMQEVAALCDQIVVMGAGRILAQGSPDTLRTLTGQADLEDAFVSLLIEAGVQEQEAHR